MSLSSHFCSKRFSFLDLIFVGLISWAIRWFFGSELESNKLPCILYDREQVESGSVDMMDMKAQFVTVGDKSGLIDALEGDAPKVICFQKRAVDDQGKKT